MQSTDDFASTPLNDRGCSWTLRSAKDGGCIWTHRSEDTDVSTQPGTPRTESVCSDDSGSFASTADVIEVYWGVPRGHSYTDGCLTDEHRLADVSSIMGVHNTRVESESTTSRIYWGLICGDTGMDLILSDEDCFADTIAISACALVEVGNPTWEAGMAFKRRAFKSFMQALWDFVSSESNVEALGGACRPKYNERPSPSRTQGCDMHTGSRRMSTSRHVLCDASGLQEKCSARRQIRQECANKLQAKAGLRAIKEDGSFHGTFSTSNSIPFDKIVPTSCTEALPTRTSKLFQCIDDLLQVHPATVSGWECVASSV